MQLKEKMKCVMIKIIITCGVVQTDKAAYTVWFEQYENDIPDTHVNRYVLTDDCRIHWHDFYEVELILAGSGTVVINGKSYEAKRGLVYFLDTFDYHEIYVDGSIELYNLAVTRSAMDRRISMPALSSESRVAHLNVGQTEKLTALFELITDAGDKSFSLKDVYCRNLIDCLLIMLSATLESGEFTEAKESPEAIQIAVAYLNEHFCEAPQMKDIAAMLYLDEHYFCSIFKKYVGRGYKEYIRELRLNYALRLVLTGSMPLVEVGRACGYRSHSHFTEEFRASFGDTPSHVRKNKKPSIPTLEERMDAPIWKKA